jgi:GNAT superfamily N-acetyltransferase
MPRTAFTWVHENPPHWDAHKARIVGATLPNLYPADRYEVGSILGGDWWRVEDGVDVVGYGWMDVAWGDAEILLAVDPERQGTGVGRFIMEQLAKEAARQGVNYVYNLVPDGHPDPAGLTRWLEEQGFRRFEDGSLRRRVRAEP